ncbi:MAG: phosphotransferase [Pseudomonadota bacterium]|nr:phosphotransferase [Pseudomonadota bacterium]
MSAPFPDPREARRLGWSRQVLGDATASLARASTDAGFRSYWRVSAGGDTCIVMDSPPALEDVRPWLRVHALLEAAGVRVPRVLAEEVAEGFLLLEDLGSETLLQVLDAGNTDALFDAALTQLLRLQSIAVPAWLPAYDQALLSRELQLFEAWFLGRHLGVTLTAVERDALASVHRVLVHAALAQPQVLVHRDFMPRNLMPVGDGPAVLDFQDAVVGPIAYDPLCLFKDAFLDWPQDRIDGWLDQYHARAAAAGLPVPPRARFRRDVDLVGVQRHLKVLGIFARLHHRDGKPKYLQDAPRFITYLDAVLPRHPELAPLSALLERYVHPALPERV